MKMIIGKEHASNFDGSPVVLEFIPEDSDMKVRSISIDPKWDGCVNIYWDQGYLHICDLNEFIDALIQVRDESGRIFNNSYWKR